MKKTQVALLSAQLLASIIALSLPVPVPVPVPVWAASSSSSSTTSKYDQVYTINPGQTITIISLSLEKGGSVQARFTQGNGLNGPFASFSLYQGSEAIETYGFYITGYAADGLLPVYGLSFTVKANETARSTYPRHVSVGMVVVLPGVLAILMHFNRRPEESLWSIGAHPRPKMSLQVSVPKDEEFKKMLKEALEKPDGWYDERVDRRAVKGAIIARRGRVRVPGKSRRKVR